MKRIVNGVEAELSTDAPAQITAGAGGLLHVRTEAGTATAVAIRQGDKVHVSYRGRQYIVEKPKAGGAAASAAASGELKAPMAGVVVSLHVEQGEAVTLGQKLAVLEAMKTHQPISAPFDGTVDSVRVKSGDQVSDGQLLIHVSPADSPKVDG